MITTQCPYSLHELIGFFSFLYDAEPAYDPMNPDHKKEAQFIWDSLEDWCKREITDYYWRPSGLQ